MASLRERLQNFFRRENPLEFRVGDIEKKIPETEEVLRLGRGPIRPETAADIIQQEEKIKSFKTIGKQINKQREFEEKKIPSLKERLENFSKLLFPPTRRELLEQIQEERQQTLLPSTARRLIQEREFEMGIFPVFPGKTPFESELKKVNIPEAERERLSFQEFLKQPRTDIPLLGGTKRAAFSLRKNAAEKIAKSQSVKEIGDILRKSNIPERVVKFLSRSLKDISDPKRVMNMVEQASRQAPELIEKKSISRLKKIPKELESIEIKSIPEREDILQKLQQELKKAKILRGKQEKIYTKERAQRLAKMRKMSNGVKGEEGYIARLGALTGEFKKVNFESIADKFSKSERDALYNAVWENPHLSDWEKVSAANGLTKLLGVEGGRVPGMYELEKLSFVFPEEVMRQILKKRGLEHKITNILLQIYNLSRTTMAGFFDLSAVLLQNIFQSFRHPIITSKNVVKGLRSFGSENFSQFVQENIRSRENYPLYQKAKIQFTKMSPLLASREETFMTPMIEKIPFLGPIFKATGRSWTDFLNLMRADIADFIINNAKIAGKDITDKRFLKTMGKWINISTGRGDLGQLERIAPILGQGFFSARKLAAAVQIINPAFYIKADPFVRKEALKTWLAYLGGGLTILGLAKLAGAEVGDEPTSADFGKIKIGNTRFNIWGTNQQLAVLFSRLWIGHMTSSVSGNIIELGEGYKPITRVDIIKNFFKNKEHPSLSFIVELISGTDQFGRSFEWTPELISRFIPMIISDSYDLYQEHGTIGLLGILPLFFGVPTQTYGDVELKRGKNIFGEDTIEVVPKRRLENVIADFFGPKALLPTTQTNADLFYRKMLKMPPEYAAELFDIIAEVNPDLAKKLLKADEEHKKGITNEDRLIRSKGIASGERAKFLVEKFKKIEDQDVKARLWDEYVDKGIITDEVANQIYKLLQLQ